MDVGSGLRLMILMASRAGGQGGRETAIQEVATGLTGRGHHVSVTLVGPSRDRKWEERLPNLHVGPLSATWDAMKERPLATAVFVSRVLRRTQPDAILVTEPAGSILVRASAFLAHANDPVVASWIHSNLLHVHHTWALRYCDCHLAISEGIAAQLRGRFRAPVFVVHNPVEPPSRLCARPSHGEGARFLFMGRLEAQKRVDRLLRALAGLRDQRWMLDVVGDGALRPELERLADELQIAHRIAWRGWVQDAWAVVGPVSALVLTSDHEGFPMVLIEALARGVPLVCMDCDFGPREVIQPGVNGWLVPLDDVEGFREVLQRLCVTPAALPSGDVVQESARPYRADAVVQAVERALQNATGLGHDGSRRQRSGESSSP